MSITYESASLLFWKGENKRPNEIASGPANLSDDEQI